MWFFILLVASLIGLSFWYYQYTKSPKYDRDSDVAFWLPVGLGVLFGVFLICIAIFTVHRFDPKRLDFEKDAIIQTIESSSEIGEFDKGVILFQAVEFNQKLAERKFWASNWWTKFWVSKEVLQIEPIDLKKLER